MPLPSSRPDAARPDSRETPGPDSREIGSSPAARSSLDEGTAGTACRALLRDGAITRRLAEIAFIGAFNGRTQAAETLFRSLRLLCPGNPHVELGLAMVCAIDGRPADGLSILERIPLSPPTQQDALSHGLIPLCAGWMLQEAGHQSAAERKIAEALAQGGQVADLARELADIKRHG